MARKKQNVLLNNFYIDAVKLNTFLESNDIRDRAISSILKELKLDTNITNRFKEIRINDLFKGYDLSSYQLAHSIDYEQVNKEHLNKLIEIVKRKFNETGNINKVERAEVKKEMINYLEGKGEVSNMKNIMAIDLGNNNVKVAVNGQAFSFVNKIERLDNVEALADNEYIKMNDDYNYYILSNLDSKFEKSASKKDKNYIPTLNYAIIKGLVEAGIEVGDKIEVDLALLTPINQAGEKEEYIEKIKNNADNIVECRVNGKEYVVNIKINNVIPALEGCTSAFLLEDLSGINTIVDVGSKTINIAKIVKGKFSNINCLEDMGSFNYYQTLVNKINDRDITIDNIQDLIEVGLANHDKDLLKAYLKKVLEESNKVSKFKTNNNVFVTGGTVELFKSQGLNFEKGNIKIMENTVYSNVLGALKMMEGR